MKRAIIAQIAARAGVTERKNAPYLSNMRANSDGAVERPQVSRTALERNDGGANFHLTEKIQEVYKFKRDGGNGTTSCSDGERPAAALSQTTTL